MAPVILHFQCLPLPACVVQVFSHPAISRAKSAVAKRGNFTSRGKFFIGLGLTERVVRWCSDRGLMEFAALYVAAYAFLLRVPSEGLPMTVGGIGPSVLSFEGSAAVLQLKCRCACYSGI